METVFAERGKVVADSAGALFIDGETNFIEQGKGIRRMPIKKGTKTMKDKEKVFGESSGAVCGASPSPYIIGCGGAGSVGERETKECAGLPGKSVAGSGAGSVPGSDDGVGFPREAVAGKEAADGAGDEERLSPHFTLAEMTRSGVALRHGIANRPGRAEVESLRALCVKVLEPLRRRVGRVLVTSGFRCRELNARVGGAEGSQHVRGEAADLYVSSAEQARKYAAVIMAHSDFDQLILEPLGSARKRWIHVSHTSRRAPRRQVLGL